MHVENLDLICKASVVGLALVATPVIHKVQAEDWIRLYNLLALWPSIIRRCISEKTSQSSAFINNVDLKRFLSLSEEGITSEHSFRLDDLTALSDYIFSKGLELFEWLKVFEKHLFSFLSTFH